MILKLEIPNNGELRLEFEGQVQKFSMCKFLYVNDMFQIQIDEDYLYTFVENMLGRLEKLPKINQNHLFGELGKLQEYYYFEAAYVERHSSEIEIMEKAIFVSAAGYGIFLYEFDDKVWIEINKGYDDSKALMPMEYYSNSSNFRILLAPLSKVILSDWRAKLEEIKKQYMCYIN